MNFKEQFLSYQDFFNDYLNKTIDDYIKPLPKILGESIAYSIKDGGKRIRPILLLSTVDMFGGDKNRVLPFALSIECIHSYSLVHDDLPCMDNDDYRRGKFSTHKKFGYANGVLAGDSLLNLAFEIASNSQYNDSAIKSIKILSSLSGANGMIKGQVLDIENENKNIDNIKIEDILEIYENKTSKLLTAPLLIASIFCGNVYYNELELLGKNLGILFQITDDILDVEGNFSLVGKTLLKDSKKATLINLLGIEKTKRLAKDYYEKCLEIVSQFKNSEFLSNLIKEIYLRKK